MALTKVKGHIIADDLALGGNPTTSTQSASDNSTKIATTAYVTTAVSNLVDGAPSTLNTLNEIAAALNDDAALNTTLTNSIATKLPLAGGTMTGSIISNSNIKTTGRIEIASAQPRILLDRADGSYSWNIYNGDGTGNFPTSTFNIANNAGTAVITALDNGNVGIGTSSPTADLSVGSTSTSSGDVHLRTTKTAFSITPSNTDAGGILFDLGWVNGGQGPMKFGINGSEKMTIDSSGDVLIGQTSQTGYAFAQKLVVGDGDNNDGITIQSGSTHQGNLAFNHSDGTTAHGRISYQHNSNYMQFFTNNTERMRIDSSGNVGINATAPSEKLEVDGGIKISNSNSRLYFGAEGGTSYRALEGNTSGSLLQVGEGYSNIALQGNVGIGTSSPNFTLGIHKASAGSNYMQITNSDTGSGSGDGFLIGVASDEAATIWNYENTSMNFGTNGTERMRIHANGKVGFSANGMGNVSSIPRDFAFFTEGSTNGVEIRSNDQRLMMLGAGGSGGTASDDGYLTMSSQGTAKLWLSANGTSVFNGGAVGINRTPSISGAKLEAGGADNVPLIVAEASGFYGGIGANGSTGKGRGLQIFAQGNIIATFNNQTNVGYVVDGLFGTNARPNRINCTGSGQMLFGYTDSGSGLYSAAMGMEFDEINGLNQSQWVDGWVMKATSSGTKTLRIETDGDMYNVNGTYTSGSDRRIKKEISDASSQWDDVKAVRVRKFKLGATAPGSPHDHFHIGVIAQEIEEAGMNGLVKEMTPDDGHIRFNPSLAGDKIKTVKYSILQMKAFKALQEAMEKIETLEAKVAALEAE